MKTHTLSELWIKTIALIICTISLPIFSMFVGTLLLLAITCLIVYCTIIAIVGFCCSVLSSILYYCNCHYSVELINWTCRLFEKISVDGMKSKNEKDNQPEDLKTDE